MSQRPDPTPMLPASSWTYRLLVLYAIAVPLVVLRVSGVAIGAVDLLLPVGLVVFATTKPGRMPLSSAALLGLVGILALHGIVGGITGTAPLVDVIRSVRPLAVALPFLIARQYVLQVPDAFRLLRWLSASLSLAMFLALVIHFAGINVGGAQQTIWVGDGLGLRSRASGLLGNTGGFGYQLGIWIALVVFGEQHKGFRWRVLLLAQTGTAAALFLLSSSRAVVMFTIAAALGARFATRRTRKRLRTEQIVVSIVAIGAGIAAFFYLDSAAGLVVLRRLDVLNLTGQSTFFETARFVTWPQSLRHAFDVGAFGEGVDGMTRWAENNELFVDNSYLATTITAGLIGGVLYLTFWFLQSRELLVRPHHNRQLQALGGAVLAGSLFQNMVLDTFNLWASTSLALLVIAVATPTGTVAEALVELDELAETWEVEEATDAGHDQKPDTQMPDPHTPDRGIFDTVRG